MCVLIPLFGAVIHPEEIDKRIISPLFFSRNRPGLDQRARRWLTLVGVGNSSSSTPIRSHVWSAMASGNASREEMFEFVLQYAIHAGWPRASVMQSAVMEQAPRVEKRLPFEA